MPDVRITRHDWGDLLKIVNDKAGREMPVWQAMFNYYSVCLPSLVTPLSDYMWMLYNRLNRFQNETYASFMLLPVQLVSAINVIEVEIERIDEVRRRAQKRKARDQKGVKHGRR